MITTLLRWFRPPVFLDDEDKTRSALLLNVILNTFILAFPILLLGTTMGGQVPRLERIQAIIVIAWLVIFVSRMIMLNGRVVTAGTILGIVLFILTTFAIYFIGTIRAPATSFYILGIVVTGLTTGRRALVWMTGISSLTVLALLVAEINGLLPPPSLAVTAAQGITLTVIFIVIAVLLYLAIKSIDEAMSRVREELAERQRTEAKLRSSEEQFRAMIENISDAIALVNAEGVVFYLSPAAERILGYSSLERIGNSAFDNIAQPGSVTFLKRILNEVSAEHSSIRTFTIQARHKDGSLHWLEATAKNLLDVPSVQAIVVNYRDISQRIHAEEERERYIEELNRRNAELVQFTYTVSHDLRNPLVTIKGFLGMLEKDLKENRTEKIPGDFQRIASAADKMQALLTDLLELSRIGRLTNPPEEIDLVKLTQEAIENLDARIRSSNAAVTISPDLPTVYGDRIRLREVLENLIDNAAKYSGNLSTAAIEIGARNHEGENTIFVKDNGIGIESKYHTKIFGLFDKLDPTSEGTGIGLALIKRIIEVHGGRIWVESEGLGKGSTFCFTIPDNMKSSA